MAGFYLAEGHVTVEAASGVSSNTDRTKAATAWAVRLDRRAGRGWARRSLPPGRDRGRPGGNG